MKSWGGILSGYGRFYYREKIGNERMGQHIRKSALDKYLHRPRDVPSAKTEHIPHY